MKEPKVEFKYNFAICTIVRNNSSFTIARPISRYYNIDAAESPLGRFKFRKAQNAKSFI